MDQEIRNSKHLLPLMNIYIKNCKSYIYIDYLMVGLRCGFYP